MSRNLGQRDCHQCGGPVVHNEEPRPIKPEECGVYSHYVGELTVANAECSDCGAKYLAWIEIDRQASAESPYPWRQDASGDEWMPENQRHFDLSYRLAFNDEPADEDMPTRPPAKARALRQLREATGLNSEDCIEIAEAWMQRAVDLKGKP